MTYFKAFFREFGKHYFIKDVGMDRRTLQLMKRTFYKTVV